MEELDTCPRLDMTSGNPMIIKFVLLLKVNYCLLSVILVFLFFLLFFFSQNMSFSYLKFMFSDFLLAVIVFYERFHVSSQKFHLAVF